MDVTSVGEVRRGNMTLPAPRPEIYTAGVAVETPSEAGRASWLGSSVTLDPATPSPPRYLLVGHDGREIVQRKRLRYAPWTAPTPRLDDHVLGASSDGIDTHTPFLPRDAYSTYRPMYSAVYKLSAIRN